jgi:hypothetical protein
VRFAVSISSHHGGLGAYFELTALYWFVGRATIMGNVDATAFCSVNAAYSLSAPAPSGML